jgi:hypothetical protein
MLRQSTNRSLRTESKWLGNSFVCAQIALSLMLVVVAGLLSTTLIKLRLGHAGFRTENISTVMMDLRARSERAGITDAYLLANGRTSETDAGSAECSLRHGSATVRK